MPVIPPQFSVGYDEKLHIVFLNVQLPFVQMALPLDPNYAIDLANGIKKAAGKAYGSGVEKQRDPQSGGVILSKAAALPSPESDDNE